MALVALCLGIMLGRELDAIGSMVWFGVACGCAALTIALRGIWRSVMIVICVVMIGSGWGQVRTRESPTRRLDQIVLKDDHSNARVPIEVSGVLSAPIRMLTTPSRVGDPPMWKPTTITTHIEIDRVYLSDANDRGTWVSAIGSARVVLPKSFDVQSEYHAGDRVQILGVFNPTGTRRNIADLDWVSLANQSGRVGTIVVTDESLIHRIKHEGAIGQVKRRLSRWRAGIHKRAMEAIGLESQGASADGSRAMLGALLLGQRDPAFGEVYESFQRVGVAHVLAISGFHLALVIMLGVFFLRFVGEFPKIELLIVSAILIAGMIVVPMRPPIVRAGVIVLVFIIAGRAGRRYDRLTILAWVGVGLLIWRPMDVYSLGYQLSMGITGLLVVLSNRDQNASLNRSTFTLAKEKHNTSPMGIVGRMFQSVLSTARANIACWCVAMPAIMFHAGIVSFFAPVVSLVLIPMVIVLMVLGYVQIAIGLVSPTLAPHTIGVVEWVSGSVGSFVGLVDGLPGSSVRVGVVGWVWAVGASVCLAAIVTGYWKVRDKKAWGVLVGFGVWLILSTMLARERALLRIDMLDVGDGTCVLIQSAGEGIIWDCGSLDRRVGKMTARTSRAVGLNTIKEAIVTHDNLDHFNGLIELAQVLGLERVWVSRRMIDDPSPAWSGYRIELEALGVQIAEIGLGDRLTVGDVELECLWPDPDWIDGFSENNTSVVVQVVVPVENGTTRTVLLTGDIERQAMDMIVRTHGLVRADVVELPHHGSAKPGAYGFVRSLEPSVVMQSTGPTRLNDPRWDSVRAGRVWYASADRGGFWVRIGRDGEISHGWANGQADD